MFRGGEVMPMMELGRKGRGGGGEFTLGLAGEEEGGENSCNWPALRNIGGEGGV